MQREKPLWSCHSPSWPQWGDDAGCKKVRLCPIYGETELFVADCSDCLKSLWPLPTLAPYFAVMVPKLADKAGLMLS